MAKISIYNRTACMCIPNKSLQKNGTSLGHLRILSSYATFRNESKMIIRCSRCLNITVRVRRDCINIAGRAREKPATNLSRLVPMKIRSVEKSPRGSKDAWTRSQNRENVDGTADI